MSVGFIGLGNIGKPIARHLYKYGETVYVHDVATAPIEELVRHGAKALTPKDMARQCLIIGLCVRDDRDVDALLYGEDGLLQNARSDCVIAVHSTVTQDSVFRWSRDAAARNIHVIDAPITGGAAGAEAATLTYMVGGTLNIVDRCRPVFETSGQQIIHAGPVGAGIALKLCNNLMTYAAFAAISEADVLARAGGLNPALLIEVGRANGVVTLQMEAFMKGRAKARTLGPTGRSKTFGPFAALAKKDLAAALASAHKLGLKLLSTERVTDVIEDVFLGDA